MTAGRGSDTDLDTGLEALLGGAMYGRAHAEKKEILLPLLWAGARRCAETLPPLADYWRQMGFTQEEPADYTGLPYLPVSLFKEFDLATVPPDEVARTLLSSTTTGASPSRIPLDKITGKLQARALAATLKDTLGGHRRPFLVLDIPEINKPGEELTARGAAVRGIMPFASETVYALRQTQGGFALDLPAIDDFFARHRDADVLLFGFTYLVWTEFVRRLRAAGRTFAHPRLTLLHSGGWKKLTDQSVTREVFADGVAAVLGCDAARVRDFYGMV
ncbi:hypothetical protein CSB20_10415, partial [bacterium DOLZORAL124_64_63]